MFRFIRSNKGLTFVEVMFVAVISAIIVGIITSGWIFTYKTWTGEREKTALRVDLLKAMETIKNDIRLSSLTYMSFYPASGEPYTAISIPVAEIDSNGFFTLNSSGNINWDKTVIYHIYTDNTLRRTEYDPRDNTMTEAQRYSQLESVVTSGAGGTGSTTDTDFLENVESFEMSSLSSVIDFYSDSSEEERVGKVVFGWANLDAGDHTIRLEITGKNGSSSGYDIGVDDLMIEPSGSVRETEYYNSSYAPSGALTSSGGSIDRVYDSLWSNNNYLRFSASGVGSYIEIEDYYDLWRESSFENAILNNTEKTGEEVRLALDIPEEDEMGAVTWHAADEAVSAQYAGEDAYVNPLDPDSVPAQPIVVRVLVNDLTVDIDPAEEEEEVNYVRVKFAASSSGNLRIDRAFITRRDSIGNGLSNLDPSALTVEEYHRHQQLFFRDNSNDFDGDSVTSDIVEGIEIDAGGEVWTQWTAFPLLMEDAAGTDLDYFVTFYISDTSKAACKYWEGTFGFNRSYYVWGGDGVTCGTPDWSGYTVASTKDIFAVAEIDTQKDGGAVTSQIFDTTLSSPSYNKIKWSESKPSGTSVLIKARSSSDQYMSGATDWDSITGFSTNPNTLSIGNGRYVQFMAELSADPYWATSGATKDYASYVTDQVDNYAVYNFPVDASGEFFVTKTQQPWIDDVTIDWPGDTRLCTISGYVAKKNSYGQAKITVDGEDLVKILSVYLKVSEDIYDRTVTEENYVTVEPRNTGK